MKKLNLFLLITGIHNNAYISYEQAMEFQKSEQFVDAINSFKNIPTNDPHYLSALFNLGCCYLSLGKIDKAINAFEHILSINPHIIAALYNKAYTYKTAGDIDIAINLYQHIISIDNNYEPAQLALGFAYLTKGDFENGWKQHERYLKKSGKNGDRLRYCLQTNAVAGKIILLRPEGGLGDSLQFIRYAERLHSMGATVMVNVQKPLIKLFSLCPYISKLISANENVPPCHADATLMSLPAIFNDSETTFPHSIPYLYADQDLIEKWKSILSHDHNFKIGICWQADVRNDVSRLPIARRGCPLKYFAPLQNISNITLYSLQKYDGVEEIITMSDFPLHCFENLDEESGPFMDTAALIKNLNLIITVDTAIAHLAGALGCNVWLLLPYSTDWRWINNRTDSPWYPTMRIFKQKTPFNWQEVMDEVTQELNKLVN